MKLDNLTFDVRMTRHFRGLKQWELAAKAGIIGPYLSQIENGTKIATSKERALLAKALDVEVDDIVWGDEPPFKRRKQNEKL